MCGLSPKAEGLACSECRFGGKVQGHEKDPELGVVAQIGFEGRLWSKAKWRSGHLTDPSSFERGRGKVRNVRRWLRNPLGLSQGGYLIEYKQLALTAVMVLGANAYGRAIHKKMQEFAGGNRPVALAVVYATLDRLEKQGYLSSWFGGATKERGGRSKKFFPVASAGEKALRDSLVVARNLLRELE